MSYKRLLSEANASKPTPSQEVLDRIAAKIEVNRLLEESKSSTSKQLTPEQLLAKRQASLDAKKQRRADKTGMSVADWERQARKYYTIDPVTFTVTSVAKSPDTDKAETWECVDLIDAEEKVLQLLDYKWTDHFERTDRPLATFKWIKE